ncbi:MAG: hypothetical protein KJP09_10830 [Bacteroidia bacterium]|nr:hypothetical protein [Bacteroidia bacterium]NND12073.1 hypothetical protein [Flavobacteriaceae bacterium]MBT8309749.1 hypothetical protein [Bacteroidia bacterium]NNK28111.1 hypothetical protein [Flavobacteriaceae bacterium]NNL60033.1 hypothetical protein [Flavobacteriaceae bacterium]
MKYSRLTKEQFEELHQEFINFLATQSITAEEWSDIKANKPEVAEQELDVFSDLVWEGVLNKAKYIEHISAQQMHLFHLEAKSIRLIALKLKNTQDLTTKSGYQWLRENLLSDDVELFQANKDYSEDANLDKFKLIQQGGVITKGDLFNYFDDIIG